MDMLDMNILKQLANSMDFYELNMTGNLSKFQWKNLTHFKSAQDGSFSLVKHLNSRI